MQTANLDAVSHNREPTYAKQALYTAWLPSYKHHHDQFGSRSLVLQEAEPLYTILLPVFRVGLAFLFLALLLARHNLESRHGLLLGSRAYGTGIGRGACCLLGDFTPTAAARRYLDVSGSWSLLRNALVGQLLAPDVLLGKVAAIHDGGVGVDGIGNE